MKILCFGDSLTWGYTPYGGRYPHPWPDILQQYRKEDTVINAGQPGRTAYGSMDVLTLLLKNNHPDITCIMLGSNDLSRNYARTSEMILTDLEQMGKEAEMYGKVILMAPPEISEDVDPGWNYASGISIMMKDLARQISLLCNVNRWRFFNTQNIVQPAIPDGLHIDQNNHLLLGKAMNDFINQIM